MKILFYANQTVAGAVAYRRQLHEKLTAEGHTCVDYAKNADLNGIGLCIILGGDGTVLQAVREIYPRNDFPFWSVNFGHLGYLTECEPEHAEAELEQVLRGEYRLERRIVMEGCVRHAGSSEPFISLNEAVIHRCAYSKMLRLKLLVDGDELMNFAGDGLLVSTATGSTAYNLSAGGPVLMPESTHRAITPICAHTPCVVPLVVSKEPVSVAVSYREEVPEWERPTVTLDGIQKIRLNSGDTVECSVAEKGVAFIRTGNRSFYDRLRRKLTENI